MTHSLRILGKAINDLKFSDVQQFFNITREEHLNLEFKSNPPDVDNKNKKSEKDKLHDVISNVCAMLNAEGGIIVWGAPVEKKNKAGKKEAVGNLTAFQTKLNRDSFMNTVNDIIAPLATGVRVEFREDPNTINSFVAIIEVEKSITKPHQCKDVYYIRLDGQTRPAPHYLIRALMTSIEYPVIYGQMLLKNVQLQNNQLEVTFRAIVYNSSPFNNELNAWVRLHNEGDGGYRILGQIYGVEYEQNVSLLTNGKPCIIDFTIIYPGSKLTQDIHVGLSFGGEKSPTKRSLYLYNLNNLKTTGHVEDGEFLVEKHENLLAVEISTGSIEQRIDLLLRK